MALPNICRRHVPNKETFFATNIDLASIASETIDSSNTVTVRGAQVGDVVRINWDNATAKLVITAYVSAANTVKIVAFNPTGSAVDAAASNFYGIVCHRK